MLATLRGYKLWIYQNCDGKYLKRLTFVQRTFRLPCSSPSLTCFPGSILCFKCPSGDGLFFAPCSAVAFFWEEKVLSDYLMTVLCLSDCDASSAQYFAEVVRKRSDPLSKIPEALKSCMWAPCADYLLQDDCDFKNLYFSQKSPQCDPSALLVRENGNSGQNFNWSSIMWKTTTFIMIICLVSWGA